MEEFKVTFNPINCMYIVVDIDDDCYGCAKGHGKTPEEAIESSISLQKWCRDTLIKRHAVSPEEKPDKVLIDGIEYSIA